MNITVFEPTEKKIQFLTVSIPLDCLEDVMFEIKPLRTINAEEFMKTYPKMVDPENPEHLFLKINIDTGVVENWPFVGVVTVDLFDVKVVDMGIYALLDEYSKVINVNNGSTGELLYEGYVPNVIGDGGWGDYLEFAIDGDGSIPGWKFTEYELRDFTNHCKE